MQAFLFKMQKHYCDKFYIYVEYAQRLCHQNKAAIHNKTTYKLSTATSVTSFIDTFFCSIMWTISPVGKHMTFYFQHKAKCTCCASVYGSISQHLYVLVATFSNSCKSQFPPAMEKPNTPSPEVKGLQLAPDFTTLSLAFRWGKVSKTFLYHRGKKEDSLDMKPKGKSHTKRPLVPCIWNVMNNPSGDQIMTADKQDNDFKYGFE